jgi:hypothetical protein
LEQTIAKKRRIPLNSESDYYKTRMLTTRELNTYLSRCQINIQENLRILKHLKVPLDDICHSLGLSERELFDAELWLTPNQIRLFDMAFFKALPQLPMHYENLERGRLFINEEPVSTKLAILFMPFALLFAQIDKVNKKFNREQTMSLSRIENNRYLVQQIPYPFYQNMALGHECHYVNGVIEAILSLKGFHGIQTKHILCSKRLENILQDYYAPLNLPVQITNTCVFLGDRTIALREQGRPNLFPHLKEDQKKILADSVVWRITQDVTVQSKRLFTRGDVFNAPFCLTDVRWQNHNILKEFITRLRTLKQLALIRKEYNSAENAVEFIRQSIMPDFEPSKQGDINREMDAFLDYYKETSSAIGFSRGKVQPQKRPEMPTTKPIMVQLENQEGKLYVRINGSIASSGKQAEILLGIIMLYQSHGNSVFRLRELRRTHLIPDEIQSSKGFDISFKRLRERLTEMEDIPIRIDCVGRDYKLVVPENARIHILGEMN